MLESVRERLHGDAPAVSRVTIAGHRLPTGAGGSGGGRGAHRGAARAAGRQLLRGGSGARWTAWERGAWSQFTGSDGALSLDGQVLTATAGADYERDPLLAGLAVSYSAGDGTYTDSGRAGELRTTLLGVYPYLRLTLHQRLAVWGLLGYALHGDLTIDEQDAALIDSGAGLVLGGSLRCELAAWGLTLSACRSPPSRARPTRSGGPPYRRSRLALRGRTGRLIFMAAHSACDLLPGRGSFPRRVVSCTDSLCERGQLLFTLLPFLDCS